MGVAESGSSSRDDGGGGGTGTPSTSPRRRYGRRPAPVSVREKFEVLGTRSHDHAVVLGAMSDITLMCSRSPADRMELFRILLGIEPAGKNLRHDSAPPVAGPETAPLLLSSIPTPQSADKKSSRGAGPSVPHFDLARPPPMKEVIDRVCMNNDPQAKAHCLKWVSLMLDTDEENAMDRLCLCGLSLFLVDFYTFQATVHVSSEMMTLAAAIVARSSCYEKFVHDITSGVEVISLLISRLRFTTSNSNERELLVDSLSTLSKTEQGLRHILRADPLDSFVRCIERSEVSAAVVITTTELIGRVVKSRGDSQQLTGRQIAQVARLIDRGKQFYPSTAKTLCAVVRASKGTENELKIEREILFHVQRFYPQQFSSNAEAVDLDDLLVLTSFAVQNSQEAAGVFVLSRQFYKVGLRVMENYNPGSARLFLSVMETLCVAGNENLFVEIGSSGGLDFLLTAVERTASICFRAAQLMTVLCCAHPETSQLLLQQRQFHSLLRKISPHGTPEEMRTALEAIRILESVLGQQQVIEQVDLFLLAAMQSLLCHAIAICPIPVSVRTGGSAILFQRAIAQIGKGQDVTTAATSGRMYESSIRKGDEGGALGERQTTEGSVGSPSFRDAVSNSPSPLHGVDEATISDALARSIMLLSLRLLTDRAKTSHTVAAEIMSQLSLTRLRQLQHHEDYEIARQVDLLIDLVGKSSKTAEDELVEYGLLPGDSLLRKANRRNNKTRLNTLQGVQRFWRLLYQARKLSAQRAMVAALFKDVFLWYTHLLEDERLAIREIGVLAKGQRTRIAGEEDVRRAFEKDALASRASVVVPESVAWIRICLLRIEELEAFSREEHEAEEALYFSFIPELHRIAKDESWDRILVENTAEKEFETFGIRFKVRLTAIDRLYEYRLHLEQEETRKRTIILTGYEPEAQRLAARSGLLLIQSQESYARLKLQRDARGGRVTFLRNVYPALLSDLQREEERDRSTFLRQYVRFARENGHLGERLVLSQDETLQRKEIRKWESLIHCRLLHDGYTAVLDSCQRSESRQRSSILRVMSLSYSELRPVWLLLGKESQEELEREVILHQARIERRLLAQAFTMTARGIVEKIETKERLDVEAERVAVVQLWEWDLTVLKVAHAERTGRNAIAAQYLHTTRNLLQPFIVLRLHVRMEEFVLASIDHCCDLFITEALQWRLIQFEFLQKEQSIERVAILQLQKAEHEKMMYHLLSVTHVMMIQHNATTFLQKRRQTHGSASASIVVSDNSTSILSAGSSPSRGIREGRRSSSAGPRSRSPSAGQRPFR